ncbi:MAG: hypothetical protein GC191_13050 [Azospirillum sp.]|nr:hypothetical protein [Azospirillum sp.]
MARKSFNARRPSRRNRSRVGSSNRLKWAAIAAVPVALLSGGIWAMQALTGVESADADFCFARKDQFQVAVLVDNSLGGLSAQQLRDYETGLMRPFERAPANARISFFTTERGESGSLARPIFTICKPAGTPQEQAALSAPAKPVPYLKRQVEEARTRYRQAVADIINAAQDSARRALDSPVLELVQAVSKYDGFQGARRSLTLVTDGLQNSETAQFCAAKGHMPPYPAFADSAAYQTIRPQPLTGVDVTLLLVEQTVLPTTQLPYCTNAELRAWWPAFLEGNGAASVDLNRLRVGAGS